MLTVQEVARQFEFDSSTIQSFSFSTVWRIAHNPRMCGRFSIAHRPGERRLRRYS